MIVRVGLPESTGSLVDAARAAWVPVMLSAGRLWRRGRFAPVGELTWRLRDVALDSAGFVAMRHHGGYPWSVADYVDLVAVARPGGRPPPWAWWSQMDFCCEPEVAGDRETVRARVEGTAQLLRECRQAVEWRRWEGDGEILDPLPVLQGWHADDYERSAELADTVLGGAWPRLVGVGSVCRRQVGGPAGLLAVVARLSRVLPRGVRLHLFGVKSNSLPLLSEVSGRVESVDSMAWDLGARREAHAAGRPASVQARGEALQRWAARQAEHAAPRPQLRLWGTP